ncbi:hypothetical protein [Sinomonas sp.]|uniref:hypothetical protein n=1 Tax=Sinomonas sp. TaxID=1914986 RepID=UPI003F7E818E
MPTAEAIFSGTLTSSMAAAMPTLMSSDQGWVGITLNLTAVAGTSPQLVFGIQWSNDGTTWADADPAKDEFTALTTAPLTLSRRFDVKAKYWRPYATVTGSGASFTGSANAYF